MLKGTVLHILTDLPYIPHYQAALIIEYPREDGSFAVGRYFTQSPYLPTAIGNGNTNLQAYIYLSMQERKNATLISFYKNQ